MWEFSLSLFCFQNRRREAVQTTALYAAFFRRSAHLFFIISESRLRPSGVSLCLRFFVVDFPGGRPLLARGAPMFPMAAMARSM